MKPFLITLNLISGLILSRFTISKFAAWPESVAGFVDMAKPIGIDPTFFRIATGFIIGYAMIAMVTNGLVLFLKNRSEKLELLFTFNGLYAAGAMFGALASEFGLRSTAKWPLVYIAIGILTVAAANLFSGYARLSLAPKSATESTPASSPT